MIPLRTILVIQLVLLTVLLMTGCVGQSNPVNQTTPATQTIQESVALYKVTITQLKSTRPDYIKMDADVYNQGEVIEFYLKNEGSETLTCLGDFSSYRIYNETNEFWAYPTITGYQNFIIVVPTLSEIAPGSSTKAFRINTVDWVPGRYRIQFSCLGISRKFLIREIPKVIP